MKTRQRRDHMGLITRLTLTALGILAPGMSIGASAQTLTTLYSFAGGGNNDGFGPVAGLVADSSGAVYGTTVEGGGPLPNGTFDNGTVYKLTPPTAAGGNWTETVIHRFGDGDGSFPYAGLIADASGALYGATTTSGTVFKLTPPSVVGGAWTETILSFTSSFDRLRVDASSAVYGFNGEEVFRLTPPAAPGGAWTGSVLYTFTGGADGANPDGDLIADVSGALYGVTADGGAAGFGTVFKLTPPTLAGGSWTETVLHSFTGSDGAYPGDGLIADASGALYGTTSGGGAAGSGTVFRLTPPTHAGQAWTEAVLHSFTGPDGRNPVSKLIGDASGALYGTTPWGGDRDLGTVFKLTPPPVPGRAWTETVLHSFAGPEGYEPAVKGGLIADASGALYGTTAFGGTGDYGTVFKVTVPVTFGGVPGEPNCIGESVASLVGQFGSLPGAAAALGYGTVPALQNAITAFCGR